LLTQPQNDKKEVQNDKKEAQDNPDDKIILNIIFYGNFRAFFYLDDWFKSLIT
jgi:hypothetical protein